MEILSLCPSLKNKKGKNQEGAKISSKPGAKISDITSPYVGPVGLAGTWKLPWGGLYIPT